ncbi:MAG: glycoside hydrolase family 44 protein [Pseudomonadota bacterium]
MHSKNILRASLFALLGLLVSCGGGGGGSSGGGGNNPPPVQKTLFVATQPAGQLVGNVFATQPVVQVRANGATDTADNSTVVTASVVAGTGTAGAMVVGTATATAVGGVATFTNLGVDLAGGGYQLSFSAPGLSAVTSAAFDMTAPAGGGVITPSTPPASDVNVAVDSTQDVHAISRFIYGINGWDGNRPKNLTLSRVGGNRMTAYNWETNASNAGSDYFNENDAFMGGNGNNTPNGAIAPSIVTARDAGAGIIVTIPTIGFVSADKSSLDKEDVNVTPDYINVRFHKSVPRKGTAFTLTPDTTDHFVYQDEYLNFLDKTYPGAFASTTNPIMVNLDNEVDLWAFTHARLRGDATSPVTSQAGTKLGYDEIVQLSVDYAGAAKDVNPSVQILGPVNYGWAGFVNLQDAPDAMGRDFLNFYLQRMSAAQATAGRRLLDALDVHWYPEARGACASNPMDGCRITENVNDAGVVAARVAAPRSLWDGTYVENSWVAQSLGNQAINLLPRLKGKITANYPGTKLAITEYNYGGANHISGAIAQADVLGIFGRDGMYAATLWPLEFNNNFIFGGFEAFRNYDGANGSFGDTSIRATNSDASTTSVYASVNAANPARMVIVAINKNATAKSAGIAVTHTVRFHTAQIYAVLGTSPAGAPVAQTSINITQTNAFQYTMPANSVTTLVLVP